LETHAEAPPLLVYFHGGGFVTGDLDTHDAPCRILCRHAGIQVLAVDYRLAPEHPFPAAIDDARAAFRWARAQAESLGADPHRVCVGGDSAGGNLSTVIARMAAIEAEPQPFLQLLIYPPVDRVTSRPSLTLFREGLLLTGEDMDWYNLQYVGDEQTLLADPRVSPLLAPVPPGLCPALIFTAAFDPLRDEGEAYAAALQAAGVPTNWQRIEGQVHGFVNMVDVSPAARRAVVDIARALREHLKIASAKAA
jgi:acetyl esterase